MTFEPMTTPVDTVTVEFVREFAARYFEALNAHDVGRIVSLTSEDVFWEDPYVRGGSFRGHDALRAFFPYLWRAFPDLLVQLVDDVYLSSDGTRAAGLLRFSGIMRGPLDPPGFTPTNSQADVIVADFWEFRDDQLCHLRALTDLNDFARQIGASPPADSFKERMVVLTQRVTALRLRRHAARELNPNDLPAGP